MKVNLETFGLPIRRIVYDEERVEPVIWRETEKYERLGDVILALEKLLRHSPDHEKLTIPVGSVDGLKFRMTRQPPAPNVPGVSLLYYEKDDSVHVWDIKVEPPVEK